METTPAPNKPKPDPRMKVENWFLRYFANNQMPVRITTMHGINMNPCIVKSFDTYTVSIEYKDETLLIFKHAIASIAVYTAALPVKGQKDKPVESGQ